MNRLRDEVGQGAVHEKGIEMVRRTHGTPSDADLKRRVWAALKDGEPRAARAFRWSGLRSFAVAGVVLCLCGTRRRDDLPVTGAPGSGRARARADGHGAGHRPPRRAASAARGWSTGFRRIAPCTGVARRRADARASRAPSARWPARDRATPPQLPPPPSGRRCSTPWWRSAAITTPRAPGACSTTT